VNGATQWATALFDARNDLRSEIAFTHDPGELRTKALARVHYLGELGPRAHRDLETICDALVRLKLPPEETSGFFGDLTRRYLGEARALAGSLPRRKGEEAARAVIEDNYRFLDRLVQKYQAHQPIWDYVSDELQSKLAELSTRTSEADTRVAAIKDPHTRAVTAGNVARIRRDEALAA
jgi:hypothetical protein